MCPGRADTHRLFKGGTNERSKGSQIGLFLTDLIRNCRVLRYVVDLPLGDDMWDEDDDDTDAFEGFDP